ncbi:MAG TPA: response regulator [Herpetosiphonaceae bacterium]
MEILLVEDDAALRMMMVDILTDAGYTVTAVVSAEAATPVLRRQIPDVALVDHRLPGLPGTAFSQHLKADPRTQHIPLVLMSASALRDLDVPAGSVTYLAKPFTIDTLLTTLQNVA